MPNSNGRKLPLYKWSYCPDTCNHEDKGDIIHAILTHRGLYGASDVYHSPSLISGMKAACEHILTAIKNGESILIHGDYDVDGIVGAVMLHRFLKSQNADSRIFLPTRQNHGYGLSRDSIDKAVARHIPLIITVDCGISDFTNTGYAREKGVDVIITDHHQVPSALPPAKAIVHPQVPHASYPFPNLSGAGVAYKLILALSEELGANIDERYYLPYVALSIITDIMPVTGENRRFIKDGIKALREGYSPHIELIARAAGYPLAIITERELGIHVGSRLNAPGRLKTPVLSAQFLLEEETSKMVKIADEIDRLNSRRREIQEGLARKALEMAMKENHLPIHVLHDPTWHEGLIGTAASRVMEEMGHPVILITKGETGTWKGSGRAPEGIDLFRLIAPNANLLNHFGGHAGACGFAIDGEQIGIFRKAILEQFNTVYPDGFPTPAIEISAQLKPEKLEEKFVEDINAIAPFGRGNPEPLFDLGPFGVETANFVGGGNHLKLLLKGKNHNNDAIFFSAKGIALGDVLGRTVKIAATPKMNEFNGKRNLEFQIKDISPLDS